MKTTLIIPDLHHRWRQAEKIISAVGADEVIFLGDYFDDFNDTPDMVQDTVDWLEDSVRKPNRIHCWGNHDAHYAFPYRIFQCSGYTQWKYFIVHDRINPSVWDKLVWYHFLDNTWLLSHGGLHSLNVPKDIAEKRTDRVKFIKLLDNWLEDEVRRAFRDGANGVKSWLFAAGRARWGSARVGGLIWCDYEREFHPVQGINQIVGHTPQGLGFPKWCLLNNNGAVSYPPYDKYSPSVEQLNDPDLSVNIGLDVHGNTHWGVWDGRKLTVGKYSDL